MTKMDPCQVLPDVVFIRIFGKLNINELHRVRKVCRKFDTLCGVALSRKFQSSADWRYNYVQNEKFEQPISPFKVMNFIQQARFKKCAFKDTLLPIATCKTDTAKFVLGTEGEEEPMDDTILRIASFACMVTENEIAYRAEEEDDSRCVIHVRNRHSGKVTTKIFLRHDHKFEGICAVDMSSRAIVTTDGPHYLWAPKTAKKDPPNLKVWDYKSGNAVLEQPSCVLKMEHLLLAGEHILGGGDLTVDSLCQIKDPCQPCLIQFPKYEDFISPEETDFEVDWRLRAEFMCGFFYTNEPIFAFEGADEIRVSKKRKIKFMLVFDAKTFKFLRRITPPGGEASWRSFRELTVAGDSQEFGRTIWMAQRAGEGGDLEINFIDVQTGETVLKPLQFNTISGSHHWNIRDSEFTVCGPHILIEPPTDFGREALYFKRVEWNGEEWSLKRCSLLYPDEALADLSDDSRVDVTVVAETQVLFLWRKSSYSKPRAILRDYLITD